MGATLRRAAFAGSWYPRTAGAITDEVDRYLDAAGAPEVKGRLVALVSPHAGLHYSGPVAAHSYALLRAREGVSVVLVGPAHRAAFEGVAVHASGGWETPLGTAPIDDELAAALLAAEPLLFDDPAPHASEHSLEMQLPVPPARDAGRADRPAADGHAVAGGGGRAGGRALQGREGTRGRAGGFERPLALPAGAGREPARLGGGGGGARASTPRRSCTGSRRATTSPAEAGRWWRC